MSAAEHGRRTAEQTALVGDRPAEVISSQAILTSYSLLHMRTAGRVFIDAQGAPVLAKTEVPAALPWDHPRLKRSLLLLLLFVMCVCVSYWRSAAGRDTPPLRNRRH